MDYDLVRYNTIRNAYRNGIRNALNSFNPQWNTVILLPGGMGSQLIRTQDPFDEVSLEISHFDTVWMDVGILFQADTLKLEIDSQGRDLNGYIIAPEGPLRFLVKAYDGTQQFFTDRKNGDYNYLVFGYDWRRQLAESAAYLEEFLDMFRKAVFDRHHVNPLPRTTLLCHSQGGLVARVFLARILDPGSWFENIITVSTPFYGTSSHQKRYYEGQKPLSQIHGPAEVARIAGTLPGPYTLMYLDTETFDTYHSEIGLDADAYPMLDAHNMEPVDPYDVTHIEARNRYPNWVQRNHLEKALQIRRLIARPLPDAFSRRFYNLRSCKDKNTPTQQSWDLLPADFDPDKDDPPFKTLSKQGGGDGTVPHWSAWHASTPASNKIDLQKAKDHGTIVENEEVLEIVKQIVDTGSPDGAKIGKNKLYKEKIKAAKSDIITKFLDEVSTGQVGQDDQRTYDPSIWRGIYQEMKR